MAATWNGLCSYVVVPFARPPTSNRVVDVDKVGPCEIIESPTKSFQTRIHRLLKSVSSVGVNSNSSMLQKEHKSITLVPYTATLVARLTLWRWTGPYIKISQYNSSFVNCEKSCSPPLEYLRLIDFRYTFNKSSRITTTLVLCIDAQNARCKFATTTYIVASESVAVPQNEK